MQITDKRTFNGGLNMDVDNHVMPSNTYKYALNVRLNQQGAEGVITTVKGNELVTYSLPAGGNKVVGVKEFVKGTAVFYFVWNSNSDHIILMYDYSTNIISTVIKNAELDFVQDSLITGIDVVKFKDTTILYWTDNNGEPKKIPVEACIRYYDPIQTVFRGIYSGGSINKGEVVTLISASIFPRYLLYMSTIDNNTNTPYTVNGAGVEEAYPNTGWELASPEYIFPPFSVDKNITQLVPPPITAPLVQYMDEPNEPANRLKGNLWQFRYKYVYADGQESAWSPISKVAIPTSEQVPLSVGYIEEWRDNQIKVGLKIDNNYYIRSVKIAARAVPDVKAPLDFQLYKEVYLSDLNANWGLLDDGVSYGLNDTFTNKEDKLPINQTDLAQLFYWIPRKSLAQTITGANELIHGNCTYGYDVDPNLINVDPPVITATYEDGAAASENNLTILSALPIEVFAVSGAFDFVDISEIVSTIRGGDVITVSFNGNSIVRDSINPYPEGFPNGGTKKYSFSYKYTVKQDDVDTLSAVELREKIASDIAKEIQAQEIKEWYYGNFFGNKKAKAVATNQFFITATTTGSVIELFLRTDLETTSDTYYVNTEVTNAVVQYIERTDAPKRSFKRGSTQTFGFVYSDDLGRVTTVITNEACKQDIAWYGNESKVSTVGNGIVNLTMDVNHQPPSWATKCHIVRKRDNGISNFIQLPLSKGMVSENTSLNSQSQGYYFVNGIVDTDGLTVTPPYGGTAPVNIYLNALNGSGEAAYNNLVQKSVITYSFTKGDRLRFISNKGKTVYYVEDVEILGYNDTYNYITIDRNALLNTVASGELYDLFADVNQTNVVVEGALLEIYTPNFEDDLSGFYYETGITLDIVNGEHVGTDGVSQDYATGLAAKVNLDCGDTYYKQRWYSLNADTAPDTDGELFAVEDYNFSDVYNSRAYNLGRFNVRTVADSGSGDRSGFITEQYKPNTLFYSEPYIQGTNVNRLGTIYDTNFKETDNTFNSVQKLYSVGDRIKIYLEDKVGFAYNSRYVAASLGSGSVISSGASAPAISDIQYYDYNGGISLNPESHCFSGNREYFFDLRRGYVCRLSQDGINAISLKEIDKYIKGVSDKMLSGFEKDYCISAFDKRNSEVVFNFKWSEAFTVTITQPEAEYIIVLPSDQGIYMSQYVVGQTISLYQQVLNLETGRLETVETQATITFIDGFTLYVGSFSREINGENYTLNIYKSEVISFSDTWGVWNGFYSYIPDNLGSAGMNLVSFKDAQLYVHDSDSVNYSNFYGTDYDSYLEVVTNVEPTNVKNFLNVGVGANIAYNTDGTYPLSATEIKTSAGQLSSLINEDFTFKEGLVTAPFLRDANTPYVDYPLLQGDYLQGRWASIKLKVDSGLATPTEIFFVRILSKLSHVIK